MNAQPADIITERKYMIIIPVYNDWEAFVLLLKKLNENLTHTEGKFELLIVDDGSSISPSHFLTDVKGSGKIGKIYIIRLCRNMGHQRAIAIGLAYANDKKDFDAVIIMDADGEDNPEDVPRLVKELEKSKQPEIIFAARKKRSEGFLFRMLYSLYKTGYKALTSIELNFGNFSIIPKSILTRLVFVAELWNHYPASVLKAKIPFKKISTERKKRLKGKAQMDLISLIIHGLSALSVFGEIIGVRAFIAAILTIALSLIVITVIVAIKYLTNLAIPGWASYLVATFIVIMLQSSTLTLFFIFMILHSRNYSNFIPERDYNYFILEINSILLNQD